MLVTGCLKPREAYDAVEVPVLVLIIGTIALGRALTETGAADLYARGFLSLFRDAGPHAILAGLRPGVVSALVELDARVEDVHAALNLDLAFEQMREVFAFRARKDPTGNDDG